MVELGIVTAVIIALGEFAKLYVGAKYIPLISLILGVIAGIVYIPHGEIAEGVFNGIVAGLMACGLYDLKKPIVPEKGSKQ